MKNIIIAIILLLLLATVGGGAYLMNVSKKAIDTGKNLTGNVLETGKGLAEGAGNEALNQAKNAGSAVLDGSKSIEDAIKDGANAVGETVKNGAADGVNQVVESPTGNLNVSIEDANMSLSRGTVMYSVNKNFLGKDLEVVTGKTTSVSGEGVFNDDTNIIESAQFAVDTSTFTSGNAGRDKEVVQLLGDKAIFNITKLPVGKDVTKPRSVTGELTIAGVTKDVTFETSVIEEDEKIMIKGDSQITFEEFNIKAPSAAGVYTVGDTINVTFDVVAEKEL